MRLMYNPCVRSVFARCKIHPNTATSCEARLVSWFRSSSIIHRTHIDSRRYLSFLKRLPNQQQRKRSNESFFYGSIAASFAMAIFGFQKESCCEALPSSFSRRLLEIAYTGTDHYGTISEEEEDAVNATGGHWAYGEISFEGLEALLHRMDVGSNAVFYDFGSGLGKVTAQSLLTTQAARVVGIEMAVTRHTQAWQACERLGKLLELVTDLDMTGSGRTAAAWFEQPSSAAEESPMAPTFVLRVADGRELRLVHGDCLRVPADDATHIYMANLTWPDAVVARIAGGLGRLPALRSVASLRRLDPAAAAAAGLREDGVMLVPMSWQDRNRESYGVPVYLYARAPAAAGAGAAAGGKRRSG